MSETIHHIGSNISPSTPGESAELQAKDAGAMQLSSSFAVVQQ
jgi:hypothetical protein